MLTNAQLFNMIKEINLNLNKIIKLENRVISLLPEVIRQFKDNSKSLRKEIIRLNNIVSHIKLTLPTDIFPLMILVKKIDDCDYKSFNIMILNFNSQLMSNSVSICHRRKMLL